tara:strand:- start:1776 stop:2978 length:1203 start_codon:yes stop_codon:yes gene_type:complete
MLEQAIVDAQALREAALKNAEQALIEKFAPQIKEAVETLLEGEETPRKQKVSYEGKNYTLYEVEDGQATIVREGEKPFIVAESELSEAIDEKLLQEEEGNMAGSQSSSSSIEAPFAGSPLNDPDQKVQFSIDVEEPVYVLDLEDLKLETEAETDQQGPSELSADLGLGGDDKTADEGGDDLLGDLNLQESLSEDEDEDALIEEIMNLMNEIDDNEILEEELIVDMKAVKDGTFQTDEGKLQYQREMQLAHEQSTQFKEENEGLKKDNEKLKETIKRFKHKNKQYKDVVEKLSQKVNETLLSNARLLYSNKTLSDASLNERQKTKIVEAIAKAKSPEEAKSLCETLSATVTSSRDNKSPRTLSESVQRKSNLSGILPRRKQVNETVEHTFAEHMKKLAGIK